MKLLIWPLPALIFTLFSHAILQVKIAAVKRTIIYKYIYIHSLFNQSTDGLLTVSYQCPAHHTPMGQDLCCLKRQFSKGSACVRLYQLSGVPIHVLDAS